jgi:hypothetical protein
LFAVLLWTTVAIQYRFAEPVRGLVIRQQIPNARPINCRAKNPQQVKHLGHAHIVIRASRFHIVFAKNIHKWVMTKQLLWHCVARHSPPRAFLLQ